MADLIGQSLGRYHILEQLGEGGMATVYKAYDTRLERDVAVKVIRTDQFAPAVLERMLMRFEREAKALARLTHPNIVHINDYGEHDGIPYLVMDYLPGGTLKQKLGRPMQWQEAVRLLLPIAEALDYAHSQNIIHRDIKPSNILLTGRGQPMLTDFGIAKLLESEETQTLTGTGAGVGTPEYMSPEQANARPVDARTDVYSLGIVLYELITGRRPFEADTPIAVMIMQARDPLPRPTHFVSDIPEGVEKVLLKALAKKADNRYQGMGEFATALDGLMAARGKSRVGGRKIVGLQHPQSALPSLDTVMMEQGDQQATRLQDTAQAEQPSIKSKLVKQDPLLPESPVPLPKKDARWPWVAGLGGLVLLTLIILVVLSSGNQFTISTPTATLATTWTAPSTPTRTVTLTPTLTPIRTWTRTPTSIPLQGLEGSWSMDSYIFTIEWQESGYVVTWCNIWIPVSIGTQNWDASIPRLSWTCYWNSGDGIYYYYFETVSVNDDQLTVNMVYSRDQTRLGSAQEYFYRNP